MLLLWLSIIILVPFDLTTIDTDGRLIQELLQVAKKYINSASLTRDAAAVFLSKFFCRPDI